MQDHIRPSGGHDFLRDLAKRLFHVPVMFNINGEDIDRLITLADSHAALLAAVRYADTRAVSRAAYPHACIEERKLRDLIDAAMEQPHA